MEADERRTYGARPSNRPAETGSPRTTLESHGGWETTGSQGLMLQELIAVVHSDAICVNLYSMHAIYIRPMQLWMKSSLNLFVIFRNIFTVTQMCAVPASFANTTDYGYCCTKRLVDWNKIAIKLRLLIGIRSTILSVNDVPVHSIYSLDLLFFLWFAINA